MSHHIHNTFQQIPQYTAPTKTEEARRREALRRLKKKRASELGGDSDIDETETTGDISESFNEKPAATVARQSAGSTAPTQQKKPAVPAFGRLSDTSLRVMLEAQEYVA